MNKKNKSPLIEIISNDYCIGCGVCATLENSPYEMTLNEYGKYFPNFDDGVDSTEEEINNLKSVCPFSNQSLNEDYLGENLFSLSDNINHDKNVGYYLKNYAAYVKKGDFRKEGSSGGMGTWLANKLLEDGYVDSIIHVGSSQENVLFEYKISNNLEELNYGSKSKYYPIEMSKIINEILLSEKKYAIIGIPCFIKSIRLLANQNEKVKEKILYTVGLVCGHLKSDYFAKEIGWELGIKPSELKDINFRKKYKDKSADNYGVEVKGVKNGTIVIKESLTRELFTTDWGQGFFKYNACEFCDDVLAETADVTIGDAWLPKYVQDGMGTNVISVRNKVILDIIEKYKDELCLENLSLEDLIKSQHSGLRHRREGLAYRLYLKDSQNEWRPQKRVLPNDNISDKRKRTYEHRQIVMDKSIISFKNALDNDNLQLFFQEMKPIIKNYKKVSGDHILIKVIKKIKGKIIKY